MDVTTYISKCFDDVTKRSHGISKTLTRDEGSINRWPVSVSSLVASLCGMETALPVATQGKTHNIVNTAGKIVTVPAQPHRHFRLPRVLQGHEHY